MPEIDIDFTVYLPTINTFKNYYDILRSNDNSTNPKTYNELHKN